VLDNTERWMELCALAAEQDSLKLLALTQEITRLLDEKARRINGRAKPSPSDSRIFLAEDFGRGVTRVGGLLKIPVGLELSHQPENHSSSTKMKIFT
jgi:hypothetical protein